LLAAYAIFYFVVLLSQCAQTDDADAAVRVIIEYLKGIGVDRRV
jgi:hypothetical protein